VPGRLNIVLSRDVTYESKDCVVVHDAKSAFARAEQTGAQEAFVTGGTQIYTDMLPLASTIYLTRVHASPVGDAHFTFDEREWVQTSDEAHPANPENHDDFAFTFQIWKRR
jgi:dihydrofolate reductase